MNKETLIEELGKISIHLQYLSETVKCVPNDIIIDIASVENDVDLIRIEIEEMMIKERNGG